MRGLASTHDNHTILHTCFSVYNIVKSWGYHLLSHTCNLVTGLVPTENKHLLLALYCGRHVLLILRDWCHKGFISNCWKLILGFLVNLSEKLIFLTFALVFLRWNEMWGLADASYSHIGHVFAVQLWCKYSLCRLHLWSCCTAVGYVVPLKMVSSD